MIRTLIFGAIAGYVGKKLYDEGKLTEFTDDLKARYQQVRHDISDRSANASTNRSTSTMTPTRTSTPQNRASSSPLAS